MEANTPKKARDTPAYYCAVPIEFVAFLGFLFKNSLFFAAPTAATLWICKCLIDSDV